MRIDKYWVINPMVNFVAGIGTGYALQKAGVLDISYDRLGQIACPVGIGIFEYMIRKKDKDVIINSNGAGIVTFGFGAIIGRKLADVDQILMAYITK